MQSETSAVLASKNQDRGFFGRIRHHAEPHPAWALAMEAIGNATACSDEAARDFLDSRYGRHLADEVVNALVGRLELPAAIDSAVARWMRRRTAASRTSSASPKVCPTSPALCACTRRCSTHRLSPGTPRAGLCGSDLSLVEEPGSSGARQRPRRRTCSLRYPARRPLRRARPRGRPHLPLPPTPRSAPAPPGPRRGGLAGGAGRTREGVPHRRGRAADHAAHHGARAQGAQRRRRRRGEPAKAPKQKAARRAAKATGDAPQAAAPAAREKKAARARKGEAAADHQPRAGTKLEQFIKLLRRPKGVSIKEASEALDWMQHSVRGAVAGALKKTYRLTILSEKVEGRGTVYRLKV